MAPRGTAHAKPKACAAKAKAASQRVAASSGATLVEEFELDANEAASAKRRELKRRSTDSAVTKAIADNFKGFAEFQTDILEVSGRTLRDTILRDKRRQKGGDKSIAMGAAYYKKLRNEFGGHAASIGPALVVQNASQDVDPALKDALVSLQMTPAKTVKILDFCRLAERCNQRELVGLYKSQLLLRPSASKHQLEVSIEMMRYVAKHKLQEYFPDESSAMLKAWDDALVHQYLSFKTQGLQLSIFWQAHSQTAGLVLSTADVEALFAAKGRWTSVEREINSVCASCSLGARMFGFVQDRLVSDKFNDIMVTFTTGLLALPRIDEAAQKQQVAAVKEKLKCISNLDSLPSKRTALVNYLGIIAHVPVVSISDEIDCRWSAVVKARAVQHGTLEPMMFEEELVDPAVRHTHTDFSQDLRCFREAKLARASANAWVKSECPEVEPSGSIMKDILVRKTQALIALDRTYKVDISIITGMQGAGGVSRLEAAALACLPSEKAPMTVQASLAAINTLSSSALYNFCGKAGQTKVSLLKGLISAVARDARPSVAGLSVASDFGKTCLMRLAFFAAHKVSGEGGDIVVYGRAAVEMMLEVVREKAKNAARGALALADLQGIGKFHWLLNPDEAAELKEWTTTLLGNPGGLAAAPPMSNKEVTKDSKTEEKRRKNKAEAQKLVDSFLSPARRRRLLG